MSPEEILLEAEEGMEGAVNAISHECAKIRTGRANTAILDGIDVECYGGKSPIAHVANLSIPEPRTIIIQPYDKSILGPIEIAINKSDLGLNPNSDGNVIRLNIPDLTEERRKDLVKVVKKIAEEGRVSIRTRRHKAIELLKSGQKEGLIPEDESKKASDEAQKLTDKYNEKIDHLLKEKEEEILTI